MSLRRGAAVGRTLAVGFALAAAVALPVRAQQQIPMNTSVTGQITQMDPVMNDQTHYKPFTFQGTAGQTVTIDLMSADFDAYLYLKDQNGNTLAHDDDSGGGRNARIVQTLPYTGMYQVFANTVSRGETGSFTLQVRGGGEAPPTAYAPPPPAGAGAQQIPIGTTVQGELTAGDPTMSDGSHYKMFTFMGTAGQTVQIDLMSTAFDSYLYLRNSGGTSIAHDDDGGGNLNARIIQTLPYTGLYQVLANTLRSNQYGPFTLQVQNVQSTGPLVSNIPQGGVVTSLPSVNSMGMVGQIGLNQQVQNTLLSGGVSWNGKPIHLYGYQCAPGQTAQVDVLSSWDNYLIVFDPNGMEIAHDDDSGEGLNARLVFSCPTAGLFRLGVSTGLASTTPGTYTLQVQQRAGLGQVTPLQPPSPVVTPPAVGAPSNMIPAPGQTGQIMIGQSVQGRLEPGDQMMGSDSTYADIWQFQAAAGQAVAIQLSSEDFPTYLQLLDGSGNVLQESAGHPNSGLAYTLPTAGTYQIVVNSNGRQRRTGLYLLTVR